MQLSKKNLCIQQELEQYFFRQIKTSTKKLFKIFSVKSQVLEKMHYGFFDDVVN